MANLAIFVALCLATGAYAIRYPGTPTRQPHVEEHQPHLEEHHSIPTTSYSPGTGYGSLPYDYDRLIPPFAKDRKIDVRVSAHVLSMYDFDPVTMQITGDMYLRQTWKDDRLTAARTGASDSMMLPGGERLLWIPDLFIVNAVHRKRVDGPSSFVKIATDGTVKYSQKLQIRTICQSNLAFFPHDKPNCTFLFESYGFSEKHMSLSWERKPTIDDSIIENSAPELYMNNLKFTTDITSISPDKKYGRLTLVFEYARTPGFYIQTVVIPTALFSFATFFVFFMNGKYSLVPRVVLSSVMILATVMSYYFLKSQMPHVPYHTSFDVWTISILAFITLALVESVVVGRIYYINEIEEKLSGTKIYMYRFATWADKVFVYLYPTLFIFFVATYSVVYLS